MTGRNETSRWPAPGNLLMTFISSSSSWSSSSTLTLSRSFHLDLMQSLMSSNGQFTRTIFAPVLAVHLCLKWTHITIVHFDSENQAAFPNYDVTAAKYVAKWLRVKTNFIISSSRYLVFAWVNGRTNRFRYLNRTSKSHVYTNPNSVLQSNIVVL